LLILLYHHVGRPPRGRGLAAHWISPLLLRRQLAYLRHSGYTLLPPREALAWLDDPDPEIYPALITFDDGLRGLHEHALPLMRAEGVSPLLFSVAGHLGRTTSWEPNPRHRHNPVLTADQLRELHAAGWVIGSHTVSHLDLSAVPSGHVGHELRESKRILQEVLDEEIGYLAYPYGHFTADVAAAARGAGYQAAFATIKGLNDRGVDRFALRRVNVRRWSWPLFFRRKIEFAARLTAEGRLG
jgi:peptidoglycan/xylan/chitin deacetylase (PgdA/CDA1 family)